VTIQYEGEASVSRCLVTGANGFIGSALLEHLRLRGIAVRGAVRQPLIAQGEWVQVAGLAKATDWRPALQGCDVLVHTAGRAHVLRERQADAMAQFRAINVDGTLALAEQALEMGVRRFVFISSIGVNGSSSPAKPFSEQDLANPHVYYAQSKLEAELGLRGLLHGRAMELVIVRPPLVYSGHAPGNFARLLGVVWRGMPMPFGRVENLRSMVALENLVDFLRCCISHPAAANQLFLISDGQDVSTRELVNLLAKGMGRRNLMLPIPPFLLAFVARALGRAALYEQLCGTLQVDISKSRDLLGWQPPASTYEALMASAQHYSECKQIG